MLLGKGRQYLRGDSTLPGALLLQHRHQHAARAAPAYVLRQLRPQPAA